MSLSEKLGKMPAWKAGLALILTVGLMIICVEEYVINKAFSYMNRVAANFERQFADDDKDVRDEYDKEENYREYNSLKWELIHLNGDGSSLRTFEKASEEKNQKLVCLYSLIIKKFEKLKTYDYPKAHPEVMKDIVDEMASNKKRLEDETTNTAMLASQCKDADK